MAPKFIIGHKDTLFIFSNREITKHNLEGEDLDTIDQKIVGYGIYGAPVIMNNKAYFATLDSKNVYIFDFKTEMLDCKMWDDVNEHWLKG